MGELEIMKTRRIIKLYTVYIFVLGIIGLLVGITNDRNTHAATTNHVVAYKKLSDNRIDYTENIGFDFYEKMIVPGSKENGRGKPIENLVSNYGDSYIKDELLKEDVIRFRRWEWQELYASLNEKEQLYPHHLNIYRLQAEVYLVNKNYREALSQLDKLLRIDPLDKHALILSILASKVIGEQRQFENRLAALKWMDKTLYEAVDKVFVISDSLNVKNVDYGTQPITTMVPDAIAVFGQSPNSNGTVSSQLLLRLQKAKEMADKFPNAKLVLTGGPVRYEYAEADVMAKWLVSSGIDKNRLILDDIARDTPGNAIGLVKAFKEINAHNILVVGTVLHLPRASTVLKVYGEAVGYPMTIDAAGGDEKSLPSKKEEERLYTYVNAMRAAFLYTQEDIDKFPNQVALLKENNETNNEYFSMYIVMAASVFIICIIGSIIFITMNYRKNECHKNNSTKT